MRCRNFVLLSCLFFLMSSAFCLADQYGDYGWQDVVVPSFNTLPKLLEDERIIPGSAIINVDGRIVWVASRNEAGKKSIGFILWDAETGTVERIKDWSHGEIFGMAHNVGTGELLIRIADAILIANPRSFEVKKRVSFGKATVWHDMLASGNELAVLAGNGREIQIYDSGSFTLLRTVAMGQEKIQRICSLGGTRVVLWSSYLGGFLRIADMKNGEISKGYRLHGSKGQNALSKLVYFGDGQLLLLDHFSGGVSELLAFSGVAFVALNNGGQVSAKGLGWRIRPRIQPLEAVLNITPTVDMPATELVMVLPVASMYHQELSGESFPEGGEIVVDKLGNRSLRIALPPLKAGESYKKTFYRGIVTRYQLFFNLAAAKTKMTVAPELEKYISDRKVYDLNHPEIINTLQRVISSGAGISDTVQQVYRFAVNIPYGTGFEPAPSAIVKGSGGCTEHSYIQVALLRKAGIPARFVWSCIGDRKGEAAFDHKFAEAWLPDFGWVPLEPLAGTREYAGTLINYPLVFSVMDAPVRDYILNGDRLLSFAKPYNRFWKLSKPSIIFRVGERQQLSYSK